MNIHLWKYALLFVLIFSFLSCGDNENLRLPSNSDGEISQPVTQLVDANKKIIDEIDGITVSNLFRKNSVTRSLNDDAISSVETICDSLGNPLMYIVNYRDNQGYTIVSATKNYLPIVAYSDKGAFNSNIMKQNASYYWDACKKTIANAHILFEDSIKRVFRNQWIKYEQIPEADINSRTLSDAEINKRKQEQIAIWQAKGYACHDFGAISYLLPESDANAIIEDVCHHTQPEYDCMETTILIHKSLNGNVLKVDPLLTTQWGQGYPFNLQITNNYPAGCVATAMAQIMNFHQWPLRYNWANMSTSYPNVIASFFKEIGSSVHMSYGKDGSSASNQNAYNAFVNNYNYKAQLVDHSDSKINQDLKNRNPVYMYGSEGNAAHAWVCDGVNIYQYGEEVSAVMLFPVGKPGLVDECAYFVGRINSYTSDYYHMNWGWDGINDGWFANSNISYKNNRKDIINISPNR